MKLERKASIAQELYPPKIHGEILADKVEIGAGVVVEEGVVITGKGGPAERVVLGDFVHIGHGTQIMVPEFLIGDYSKLHKHSFAHGRKPMQIGRNCWIGERTILDSIGGLDIDDNVGIGAQSQVWTHIEHGDIVEGSRFHSSKYMHIGKDAWFVGHCLVSPVRVGEKSMALLGSVVTKDMFPNHIFAGAPAKDVTEKMGYHFERRTTTQKAEKLRELITNFEDAHPTFRGQLVVVENPADAIEGVTTFDISNRTYTRIYSEAEVTFLKENPLVKVVPKNEPQFVVPQQETTLFDGPIPYSD